ncbi:MAG: hypothetical protein A3D94_10000 [Alphaproteobacteria bacterium RIFCSPHIGHO2_12_FULL_66_14]|nr:MAG: hypothetical protein A3D94_10000 [Alphaproteobacteria bacterium RIFCSPHIGHO2_12_FULL_66_14]
MRKAFEPVVHDDQLEHGIALAAADLWAGVARREIEGDGPGERHDRERRAAGREPRKPLAPVERAGQPPAHEQSGSANQGGEHLDVEGEAERHHGEGEGKPAAAHGQRHRDQQEQHQPGIGVVGAIGRDGHGREGKQQGGEKRRDSPERPAHEAVEQRYRGHAGQRLRQMDRPAAVAQHGGEGGLDPESERRLVERDQSRRIEGVVEEEVGALQHAAHTGGIVFVAEAVGVEVPESQERRGQQDAGQRGQFASSQGRQHPHACIRAAAVMPEAAP